MAAPTPVTPRPRLLHRKVSEAQREAARRNGARSRGPATAQGKNFSSRNARKHGLYARLHVFSEQEERAFQDCLQDYLGFWQPANSSELALVYGLAFSDYQQQRAAELEASLLSDAMEQTREAVDQTDPQADDTIRLAVAWQSLVENSNILSALSRFEARYSRLYHRTLAELQARANIIKRTPELLDSATSAPVHHVSVVDARDAVPPNNVMKRTREAIDSKRRNGPDPASVHQNSSSSTLSRIAGSGSAHGRAPRKAGTSAARVPSAGPCRDRSPATAPPVAPPAETRPWPQKTP